MTPTLNEGVGLDMAMLKVFKRYFKLKNEMNEIEETVKQYGFKSVEACIVFMTIAESPKPCLRKEIEAKSTVGGSSATILLRLIEEKLIRSVEDPSDSRSKTLKRLLYSATPNGLELYEKLKSQLQ